MDSRVGSLSELLPHSTKLELRKIHQTRMDSGRAFTLELPGGLPTSREVLQPSEPHLSLYSTKNELGSTIGSSTSLSSHLLPGGMWGYLWEVRRISTASLRCFGALGQPADHTRGLPSNLLNLHRLQESPTSLDMCL
jgi:hypothetical protein